MKEKGTVVSHGILVAILTVCLCLSLTACGSKVAGTYTLQLSGEDITGKSYMAGFIDAMASMGVITGQTNTLVLNGDKSYELTKEIQFDTSVPAAQGLPMAVKYTFKGTYTAKDDQVTLSAATYCTAFEQWGGAAASLGEKDTNSDEDEDILYYFNTQYWDTKGNDEQVVTIDTENLKFAY